MSFINNNNGTSGRFANQFFRNTVAHFISEKWDLDFKYSMPDAMSRLGLMFYKGIRKFPINQTYNITNRNFMKFINGNGNGASGTDLAPGNINLSGDYFQTVEYAHYLREYINRMDVKSKIIAANPYRVRYKDSTSTVFVHVRLDDARQFAPSFQYFDSILAGCQFDEGWISSDSINDPICKQLIQKYGLKVWSGDEVDTIQFASTCKTLILSNGTFSWLMGLLAFRDDSIIHYPKIKKIWHGDIFVFPDWICNKW